MSFDLAGRWSLAHTLPLCVSSARGCGRSLRCLSRARGRWQCCFDLGASGGFIAWNFEAKARIERRYVVDAAPAHRAVGLANLDFVLPHLDNLHMDQFAADDDQCRLPLLKVCAHWEEFPSIGRNVEQANRRFADTTRALVRGTVPFEMDQILKGWEVITPPSQPGSAAVVYKITVRTDDGDMVGIASHGWDVLAKLRNAMDRGYTQFELTTVTPTEARDIDPGPA
jgi:hypothetical protein